MGYKWRRAQCFFHGKSIRMNRDGVNDKLSSFYGYFNVRLY